MGEAFRKSVGFCCGKTLTADVIGANEESIFLEQPENETRYARIARRIRLKE